MTTIMAPIHANMWRKKTLLSKKLRTTGSPQVIDSFQEQAQAKTLVKLKNAQQDSDPKLWDMNSLRIRLCFLHPNLFFSNSIWVLRCNSRNGESSSFNLRNKILNNNQILHTMGRVFTMSFYSNPSTSLLQEYRVCFHEIQMSVSGLQNTYNIIWTEQIPDEVLLLLNSVSE